MFPSNSIDSEEFKKACIKNNISLEDYEDYIQQASTEEDRNDIVCKSKDENNRCPDTNNCYLKQIQTHFPLWNGTCVPVSCNISSDIKEIYNISYDNCSSGSSNCGLNDVSCKNDDYEIVNTRKMIYCPSPQKVSSSYVNNNYELIDIGCSKNPDNPDIQSLRERIINAQGDMVNRASDENQAGQRNGPNAENIRTRTSFSGTTASQQLDLEVSLEESRLEADEQLEERSPSLTSQSAR